MGQLVVVGCPKSLSWLFLYGLAASSWQVCVYRANDEADVSEPPVPSFTPRPRNERAAGGSAHRAHQWRPRSRSAGRWPPSPGAFNPKDIEIAWVGNRHVGREI